MSSSGSVAGSILVICTGNICRSPYLERRLAQELAAAGVVVTSAGTRAVVGSDMDPQSARQLAARGGDVADFQARQLTAEMARSADLVLTATREHRADVVRLEPGALRRTFALADFHDLVAQLPPGRPEPGFLDEPDASRVALLVSAATRKRGQVQPRTDDAAGIIDPVGRSAEVFAQMAEQAEAVLPATVAALR